LRFNKQINKLLSLTVGLIRLVPAPNLNLLCFLLRLHIFLLHAPFPLLYFLLSLFLFLFSFLCLLFSITSLKGIVTSPLNYYQILHSHTTFTQFLHSLLIDITFSHHDSLGGSNFSVVAITGGCIGGAFLILGAGFAYFYGVKGKKKLKKYPSARSTSNNESGGELAFGCILTPTLSTVDMTLPPEQPKSHSGSVYDMNPNGKAEDIHATV
jgi:hypothetical protein